MGVALPANAKPAAAQSVQYRTTGGGAYFSQADTGAVARAESTLAADPRNVELLLALGLAQSGIRRYREAIQTFTRAIEIAPGNAVLYRWRGHRISPFASWTAPAPTSNAAWRSTRGATAASITWAS